MHSSPSRSPYEGPAATPPSTTKSRATNEGQPEVVREEVRTHENYQTVVASSQLQIQLQQKQLQQKQLQQKQQQQKQQQQKQLQQIRSPQLTHVTQHRSLATSAPFHRVLLAHRLLQYIGLKKDDPTSRDCWETLLANRPSSWAATLAASSNREILDLALCLPLITADSTIIPYMEIGSNHQLVARLDQRICSDAMPSSSLSALRFRCDELLRRSLHQSESTKASVRELEASIVVPQLWFDVANSVNDSTSSTRPASNASSDTRRSENSMISQKHFKYLKDKLLANNKRKTTYGFLLGDPNGLLDARSDEKSITRLSGVNIKTGRAVLSAPRVFASKFSQKSGQLSANGLTAIAERGALSLSSLMYSIWTNALKWNTVKQERLRRLWMRRGGGRLKHYQLLHHIVSSYWRQKATWDKEMDLLRGLAPWIQTCHRFSDYPMDDTYMRSVPASAQIEDLWYPNVIGLDYERLLDERLRNEPVDDAKLMDRKVSMDCITNKMPLPIAQAANKLIEARDVQLSQHILSQYITKADVDRSVYDSLNNPRDRTSDINLTQNQCVSKFVNDATRGSLLSDPATKWAAIKKLKRRSHYRSDAEFSHRVKLPFSTGKRFIFLSSTSSAQLNTAGQSQAGNYIRGHPISRWISTIDQYEKQLLSQQQQQQMQPH
eukprot:GHVH01015732.1.p1 GENE.GHVH01015732.1~~GHVH01015732.1.p1  ORF type:complete len:664 (-),score=99.43 GHVH01015732.1:2055-4046(-)